MFLKNSITANCKGGATVINEEKLTKSKIVHQENTSLIVNHPFPICNGVQIIFPNNTAN